MAIVLNGDLGITTPGLTNSAAESVTDLTYTGSLTGSTNIVNIGSGQLYKTAAGLIGVGTTSPQVQLDVYTPSTSISKLYVRSDALVGSITASFNDGIVNLGSSGSLGIYSASIERIRIDTNGQVGIGQTPVLNNGTLQVSGMISTKALIEYLTITPSAPLASINFDLATQGIQYYTTATTTNFAVNIRGSNTVSLNTMMQIGQSMTFALLVTNGTTPYYANAFSVDSVSVTPKWAGGSAPTGGNANSVDYYSFSVLKTANATFTVLGNQVKYA